MKPIVTTDNNIFISAFLGVVLLIAAMGYTLANFSSIVMLQLSSSVIVGILGFSAISLLYKAIKSDKHRLKQA